MNRNRHLQYRRSIYRKRRTRTVVITVIVLLALIFALFLIIGNVFFDKTNDKTTKKENSQADSSIPSLPSDNARQIKGSALSMSYDRESLFAAIDAYADKGIKEISIRLNSPSGTLYHYSDVADRLGYSKRGDNDISITELAQKADERSLYVSGIYCIGAFDESDELARSVAVAELAAIISESLRQGLDEVILSAPNATYEQCDELVHLVSEIRSFVPNATIGLALPEAIVSEPNAEVIDELAMNVSFMALDLTQHGERDAVEFAKERTSSMLYYLLRYKMRVLVPMSEDENTQSALIAAVESAGVNNWQTIN